MEQSQTLDMDFFIGENAEENIKTIPENDYLIFVN